MLRSLTVNQVMKTTQHSSGMMCIVNTKPLADVVRYLAFNHS